MSKTAIERATKATEASRKKLVREGVAPNGASLQKRGNSYRVYFQGEEKSPEGNTVMYVGGVDDPRYKEWLGRIERRNELKKLDRALRAMGIATDATKDFAVEKPSVEWYTPGEFIDMAREVMGCIDLDPASNVIAQNRIKAGTYYTKDDDGLAQQWIGNVWCNPPYGNFSKKFLAKGIAEYQSGNVTQAIFLVNQTPAAWFMDMEKDFDAICQVRRRISFLTPEGKAEGSPRYSNVFLYLGSNPDRFEQVFKGIGKISKTE
jgi:phage N-6-adenine-methyltransferase